MWLTLLKLLLSIASAVASYAERRQMLEAGAAQAVLKGVRDADSAIARARAARDAAGRVRPEDSRYNRDRRD